MMDDHESSLKQFPPASPGYTPSHLPFFVVGIGASAGGIKALQHFFEAMPTDNGMAFVIVLHLSPQHESNLAAILQSYTRMPVIAVTESVAIEPNHVYVISPNQSLIMDDGRLQTITVVRPYGRHVAIDKFLRSLAEVHREHAVGIILSGADSDGAVGMARLKATGGVAIAQLPEDAEHDAMPRHAIESGMVDWILPVAEMPQRLLELVKNASVMELPPILPVDGEPVATTTMVSFSEMEPVVHDIFSILQRHTGHSFHYYKPATVLRRLERRLQVTGLPDLPAYRQYLTEHSEEISLLLKEMLIGVTNFFRDRSAFEALERDMIPRLFEHAKGTEALRAWSVGCASGEEAYSIAMLLAEQSAASAMPRGIQVFASDIDEHAINKARRGLYPPSIEVDVIPGRLQQHFTREDNLYCIKRDIRDMVTFAIHNILHDPPFSKINLVACRNLLIYLNRDIQKKVFEILHYALYPNGYLFLGNAETAEAVPDLFCPVNTKHRIYQALPVRSHIVHAVPEPSFRVLQQKAMPAIPAESQQKLSPKTPLEWRLLEQYHLAGVVIDWDDAILYATTRSGEFLHYPSGEPTRNILAVILPVLQLDLQTAIFHVRQTRQNVTTRSIPLEGSGSYSAVRIMVQPGQSDQQGAFPILLLFEEEKNASTQTVLVDTATDNTLALHLQQQLRQTQSDLQSTMTQYTTSLEDARAANEEMQSMNEELRSATEELETSKEELQSINEELVTLNTELKLKVEETSKAHDDLQNFVAVTGIATIFIDRSLRIRGYTKPTATLFNLIASDVGRRLADITHRLDYPAMKKDIEQVFETLQPVEREIRSEQGQWYIARLLPYRTADDRIAGLILCFIDISTRKAAEAKLVQSEQRMRLVAASTKDYAIATLDNDGIVTSWNTGAERLFGYTEQEMLGRSAVLLFGPEEQAAGAFQQELRQAQQTGRSEVDRWHVCKDGSLVFCSGITSLLAEDSLHGYVKICRDMTGSKWMQDQQAANLEWEKRERVRAEETARLRDEFFAVLSHELKQPLNLIQLTAEMLSRAPDPVPRALVARGTDTIKHMVESQVRVIDDLMDLSRLHTGKLTLSRVEVNISEVVSRVVDLLRDEAKRKQVMLATESAPEDLLVYGDAVRLEQIVWNLLSNAIKFTPAGGTVWVRQQRENDSVCLEVADTGKGIAPEFLPHIFDMFRQGDTGTTRQYGGMGIGLALVRQLVHSHGGRVEAHSGGVGKGAQFRVFMPLLVGGHQESASPSVPDNAASLCGKRILLVDDTVETLESLGGLLTLERAQVTTASSGAEAIHIAQKASEPFDLIISDIGMPGMDGYMLLAELRKIKATETTPAIALSGFTRPADVERTLQAGYTSHMCKPVAMEQLITLASEISQKTTDG